jgi:pimeloyl-ACP methyl ester carboxylesterase
VNDDAAPLLGGRCVDAGLNGGSVLDGIASWGDDAGPAIGASPTPPTLPADFAQSPASSEDVVPLESWAGDIEPGEVVMNESLAGATPTGLVAELMGLSGTAPCTPIPLATPTVPAGFASTRLSAVNPMIAMQEVVLDPGQRGGELVLPGLPAGPPPMPGGYALVNARGDSWSELAWTPTRVGTIPNVYPTPSTGRYLVYDGTTVLSHVAWANLKKKPCEDCILIVVHGWNTTLADAMGNFSDAAKNLGAAGSPCKVYGFAWSGDPHSTTKGAWDACLNLKASADVADQVGPGSFADFVKSIQKDCPTTTINILAHSMGCRVVLAALETGMLDVHHVVLANAAVPASAFGGEFSNAANHANQIIVANMSHDKALAWGYPNCMPKPANVLPWDITSIGGGSETFGTGNHSALWKSKAFWKGVAAKIK